MPRHSYDVVVVGGGIQGSSTAYYAARYGLRVLIVEQHSIGSGTAAASGWAVVRQTKSDPMILRLAARSAALWAELARDTSAPYRQNGSYLLFRGSAEEVTVAERAAWLKSHGVEVTMLGPAALHRSLPCVRRDVSGASYVDIDGEVDPVAACRSLVTAAESLGAVVAEDTTVEGLLIGDRGVTGVRLAGGGMTHEIRAPVVVLAGGPRTAPLLDDVGVQLPVRLQRGEQLVTEPTGRVMTGRIMSARYVQGKHSADRPAGEIGVGLAVGQGPDGRIRIGSTRDSSAEATPTVRGRELLLAEAARYLRGVASLPVQRQTVGSRVASTSGRPIVGPVPGVGGLAVTTGHGGDGISLAPLSGAALAAWCAGTGYDADVLNVPIEPG